MGINDLTIYDIARRNSKIYAKDLAFVDEGRRFSYGDFFSLVNYMASGLQQIMITRGERIAIMGENSLEFMAMYFAAGYIGAILVPINPRLSKDEMEYIVKDTTPKAIFASARFHETIEAIAPKVNPITHFFSMGGAAGGFRDFSDLISNDGAVKESETEDDDGLVIIHTAAVAGRPRGALLSHRNIISSNMQGMCSVPLTKSDISLILIPVQHIMGLQAAMMTFHIGGVNILMPHFDVEKALEYIERERVTLILDYPPILSSLLEQMDRKPYKISSLKYIIGLDSTEIIMKFEQKSSAKFLAAYGQTETTGTITLSSANERPGSAGRLEPLVQVKIADDHGRDVEVGTPGEILVRGPLVFKGYWNLPSETEFSFRDGWHHTGDVGRLDKDGYFWYVKRKEQKELIKPGGENVYPVEVEAVILRHPMIKEVSVIGIPDPKWGEGIKAVCVLKRDATLTAQELIDFVANRIARYKKPSVVQFVSSLPKRGDGSIDRDKVKEKYGG